MSGLPELIVYVLEEGGQLVEGRVFWTLSVDKTIPTKKHTDVFIPGTVVNMMVEDGILRTVKGKYTEAVLEGGKLCNG